jgi:hypothetical protein
MDLFERNRANDGIRLEFANFAPMFGRILLYFCLILLLSCSNSNFKPDLIVTRTQAVLLENPGTNGKEICALPKGEKLRQLDGVSNFFTPLALEGAYVEAPWIRVQTRDGRRGWVYALNTMPRNGDRQAWLLRQQLQSVLGADFMKRYLPWRASFENLSRAPGTAAWYRETLQVRAALEAAKRNRPEQHEANYRPGLDWLPGLFPGMAFEWRQDEYLPIPRMDYGFFSRLASEKRDAQATRYFAFCISIFPKDSIESAFPIWKMPLSERRRCSSLGAGAHLQALQTIDSLLPQTPAFRAELLQWKDLIVEDIVGKETVFWHAAEPIRQELDQIRAAALTCLQERDVIALQARQRQFEAPEANGLRTDLRSGRFPIFEGGGN